MKRFMKKTFAFALALTMMLSMAVTVYGAEHTDETEGSLVAPCNELWDYGEKRD